MDSEVVKKKQQKDIGIDSNKDTHKLFFKNNIWRQILDG